MVKCRGYMFLDEEVERCLKENGYYLQTDVLDDKIRPAVGGEGRPRAIVKDIEVSGEPLTKQSNHNIRNSFRRIRLLNTLKIYDQGMRAEDFRKRLAL